MACICVIKKACSYHEIGILNTSNLCKVFNIVLFAGIILKMLIHNQCEQCNTYTDVIMASIHWIKFAIYNKANLWSYQHVNVSLLAIHTTTFHILACIMICYKSYKMFWQWHIVSNWQNWQNWHFCFKVVKIKHIVENLKFADLQWNLYTQLLKSLASLTFTKYITYFTVLHTLDRNWLPTRSSVAGPTFMKL